MKMKINKRRIRRTLRISKIKGKQNCKNRENITSNKKYAICSNVERTTVFVIISITINQISYIQDEI